MQTESKIKVVVIGGGNGSATVLNGLKRYVGELELSAVISMSDSGGSTGRLRQEFNSLPPSDIMRAVVSMSKYDFSALRQIFYRNRYVGLGKLEGHNLGNLLVTLVAQYAGDFVSAIRALEQSLEAVGRAYPVTLEANDSCVELTDGQIIRGDEAIDRPAYDRALRIKKMWLEPASPDSRASRGGPAPAAYSEALKVINEADVIIFSPGSLYTSVIATILPVGVREALEKSKAKLYYIAGNAYQLNGETGPTTLSEAVRELRQYVPRPFELVIYNSHELTKQQQQYYQKKRWGVLKNDSANLPRHNLYRADFEKDEGGLSSEKLGDILFRVIARPNSHLSKSVSQSV